MCELLLAVDLALEHFDQDGHIVGHDLLEGHFEKEELSVISLLVTTVHRPANIELFHFRK